MANLHLGYQPTQSMQAPLLTSQLPQQTTTPSSLTTTSLIPDQLLQAASTAQSIDHPGHGTATFPAPLMATSTGSLPSIIPNVNADPLVHASASQVDPSITIEATPLPLQSDITQGATPAPLTESTSAAELPDTSSSGSVSLT